MYTWGGFCNGDPCEGDDGVADVGGCDVWLGDFYLHDVAVVDPGGRTAARHVEIFVNRPTGADAIRPGTRLGDLEATGNCLGPNSTGYVQMVARVK